MTDNNFKPGPLEIRLDQMQDPNAGTGGMSTNEVYPGMRLTHLPTGIVIECDSEGSQLGNRNKCFEQLRKKLRGSE